MSSYYLFLDESKPFGNLKYLCLAGCIIKQSTYTQKIIPAVSNLKINIFNNTDAILHEIDIREAKKAPYTILKDRDKCSLFWNELTKVFTDNEFYTVGVCINKAEYQKTYKNTYANSEYFVCLQIVLENFVHFLEHKNSKGVIYIESENSTEDTRLTSHYHTIVANGTLFINKLAFQRRLTTINFAIKQENNIGLQIADFIPNPLNRKYSGSKDKNPSLLKLIESKLYDGEIGLCQKFGCKIIE